MQFNLSDMYIINLNIFFLIMLGTPPLLLRIDLTSVLAPLSLSWDPSSILRLIQESRKGIIRKTIALFCISLVLGIYGIHRFLWHGMSSTETLQVEPPKYRDTLFQVHLRKVLNCVIWRISTSVKAGLKAPFLVSHNLHRSDSSFNVILLRRH